MRNTTILLAVVAVVAMAVPAWGASWDVETGNATWHDDDNWTSSPAGDWAEVRKPNSTAQISQNLTGDDRPYGINSGWYNSSGHVEMLAGAGPYTVSTTNSYVRVGAGCKYTAGAEGTWHQYGGNLSGIKDGLDIAPQLYDHVPGAYMGKGTYTIEGGKIDITCAMRVGKTQEHEGTTYKSEGHFKILGTWTYDGAAGSINVPSYTQYDGSYLEMELDGTDTGVTKVVVSGAATLAGELDVTLKGGASLAKGEYHLMTFGSHTGDFTLDEHLDGNWTLDYRDTDATPDGIADELWLVPEPATLALLGIGGIGVLIRRRRK